jgi:hypothetical protein
MTAKQTEIASFQSVRIHSQQTYQASQDRKVLIAQPTPGRT